MADCQAFPIKRRSLHERMEAKEKFVDFNIKIKIMKVHLPVESVFFKYVENSIVIRYCSKLTKLTKVITTIPFNVSIFTSGNFSTVFTVLKLYMSVIIILDCVRIVTQHVDFAN